MASILITGASRGLGLAHAQAYAADGWQVFAACRAPEKADALRAIPGVTVLRHDAAERGGGGALAEQIGDAAIDVFINNAGMSGGWDASQMLSGFDRDLADRTFEVNVWGAIDAARAVMPAVAKSARKTIVNISSMLGSMTICTNPGLLQYRMSKAALNMAMRSMAAEWGPQGLIVISMHPGWVQTDMGGPQAHLTVAESIAGQRAVIGGLAAKDNGRFLQWNGEDHPW
jgi:NAD(P)-dependent dehydrogenase (short-subunit alcohol dehydrogenase family)